MNQPLPLPEGVSDYAIGGSSMTKSAPSLRGVNSMDCVALESVVIDDKEETPVETKSVFTIVEIMPQFNGGGMVVNNFIATNIVYPQMAIENGISGTVYVGFIIDEKGNVSDVKVLRGIGGGCDEEAIRIIKLTSGKWKPGMQNGKLVKVLMNVPIIFSMK